MSLCSCNRGTSHLHYSNNHEFFVKWGLIFFLLAEGFAFVAGYVQGSTTVYLPYHQISAYDAFMSKIAELTAPYEYLNWLVVIEELATLVLAIAAVATLHSIKESETHFVAIVVVIVLFFAQFATISIYDNRTQQALSQLPSLVSAETLETARTVEEALYRECGFWCTPASNVFNVVFSLAYVGLFVAASLTARPVTVWQPAVVAAIPVPAPAPARVPEPPQVATGETIPTKFCRYCGAKILRDSKYCEECGARLV